jgi:hypothetical protein
MFLICVCAPQQVENFGLTFVTVEGKPPNSPAPASTTKAEHSAKVSWPHEGSPLHPLLPLSFVTSPSLSLFDQHKAVLPPFGLFSLRAEKPASHGAPPLGLKQPSIDLFEQRRKERAATSGHAKPSSTTVSPSTAPAHGGVPDPPALPSKKESRGDDSGAVHDKGTAGFAASTSYAARRPSVESAAAKAPQKTAARRESGGGGGRGDGHGVAAAAAKPKVEAKAGAKTESKAASSSTTGGKPAKRRSEERGVTGAGKRAAATGSGIKPGHAGSTREGSVARDGSKDGPLSAVLRGVTFVLSGFVNPERSEVGVLLDGCLFFLGAPSVVEATA